MLADSRQHFEQTVHGAFLDAAFYHVIETCRRNMSGSHEFAILLAKNEAGACCTHYYAALSDMVIFTCRPTVANSRTSRSIVNF